MRGHRGESDFLDISGSAARVRPNFQEKFKWPDRKSTRLNSSHDQISYAVFCLKKKKTCALQIRSEEHTSELQSRSDLVCRLLLEKKNKERDKKASAITHVIRANRQIT